MIVFEKSATPIVRSGEFEIASRRVAARAFPYAGEVGPARFRFDPAEHRFLHRAADGTVLAGPHEADAWRIALLRGPSGPVLVGPCSTGEEVQGAYLAAAEGARSSGRAVYLLDPEPSGLPEDPGAVYTALFVRLPGLEGSNESFEAALARGIPSGWIFPLVPGWTTRPDTLEDLATRAAGAGARFLAPLPLADDGPSRRLAVEAASAAAPEHAEELFERVHHGASAEELRDARVFLRAACERKGLDLLPPRPVGLHEPAANASAAARLEERAQESPENEHRAALLHAAARWIDEWGRDLAPICREGNLPKVFPFGADLAREAEEALLIGAR